MTQTVEANYTAAQRNGIKIAIQVENFVRTQIPGAREVTFKYEIVQEATAISPAVYAVRLNAVWEESDEAITSHSPETLHSGGLRTMEKYISEHYKSFRQCPYALEMPTERNAGRLALAFSTSSDRETH